MSEFKEVDDRKLGRYLLNSSDCGGNVDADQLANACRRLGVSGPLEPFLRDFKVENNSASLSTAPVVAAKESPRKTAQKREKRLSNNKRSESPDYSLEQFDANLKAGNSYSKESFRNDSIGRDSGKIVQTNTKL